MGGGQTLTRCGPITLAALLAMVAMLCAEVSHAQQPTVRARKAASLGPDSRVTEPGLAAGPDNVVSVFYNFAGGPDRRAWYAAYNLWKHEWTWAEIDPDTPFTWIVDLSIAYEGAEGGFLAAAVAGGHPDDAPGGSRIVTSRFVQAPKPAPKGQVNPLPWVTVAEADFVLDKPWIVAGDPDGAHGQEYYIAYKTATVHKYLHSTDGGQSWFQDSVRVGQDVVQGGFCSQPAVYQDRPLYLAYMHGSPKQIRFLIGEDQPSREVQFTRLVTENATPPVPLNIPLASPNIRADVPGGFVQPALGTVPYLAVDPRDEDRLFIAYHDTATDDANDRDVNVYLRTITKRGTIWELGDRVKVNNDDTLYESDQFMPELIVDAAGYVHVLFYDDRRFTDGPEGDLQPDDNCPQPKFDAYYAYSPADNLNFQQPAERNRLLYLSNPSDPNEPAAFDRTLAPAATPREYNGIAWYGDRIWTAYTGTWADDPANKTLIWSSRVDW